MRPSSEPPYASLRLFEIGETNAVHQIAVRHVQLDRVEADAHARAWRASTNASRTVRDVVLGHLRAARASRRRTRSRDGPIVSHGS